MVIHNIQKTERLPASTMPENECREGEFLGRRVQHIRSTEGSGQQEMLGETLCTGLIIFNVVATLLAYAAICYMKQRNHEDPSF